MFNIDFDSLKTIFLELDEKGIDYLVLRNHEGLPNSNNAKDVDILLPSETDSKQLNSIVLNLCERLGLSIVWFNCLDYLTGYVLASYGQDGQIRYLKLDFFYGLKWRGIEYLNSAEILAAKVCVNGVFIPSKSHEAVIHLFNGLLYAKKYNAKYHQKIDIGVSEDLNSAVYLIEKSGLKEFSSEIIALHMNYLAGVDVTEKVRMLRRELIRNLVLRRSNLLNIFSMLKSLKVELINRQNFGYLISFSGPDGAGKSSIVDRVMEFFQLTGICKQKVPHHFLPSQIKPLHSLVRVKRKLTEQDYTKPYSELPVGKVSSLIRLAYYVIAFFIASQKYVARQMRMNEVVVYDRYFYDIIADPARARLSISNRVTAYLLLKVSKIPICPIILVAEPELLVKRKGELSGKKAISLVKQYSEVSKFADVYLIDNSDTIEEGYRMIFSCIFQALHRANIRKIK